jgi:hypothetical protein
MRPGERLRDGRCASEPREGPEQLAAALKPLGIDTAQIARRRSGGCSENSRSKGRATRRAPSTVYAARDPRA